jgi:hypothetical protein
MDVNEEIVEQYLKIVKGWFCMTDIAYKVPNNYSNIDILAYNPKENLYYDIEVKFRSAFVIPLSSFDTNSEVEKFIHQLTRKERNEKIQEIINGPLKKMFVTTYQLFGQSVDKRKEIETRFKSLVESHGFECEILYFDEIIPELVNQTSKKGRYNTQLMQTIRLIKTYLNDGSKR